MSLTIPYPFLEYVDTLHEAGFKFLKTEVQGWLSFGLTREKAQEILPQELLDCMSDHTSMMDFIQRSENKDSRLKGLLGDYESEDYVEWKTTTNQQSLQNAMKLKRR